MNRTSMRMTLVRAVVVACICASTPLNATGAGNPLDDPNGVLRKPRVPGLDTDLVQDVLREGGEIVGGVGEFDHVGDDEADGGG